MYNKAFGIKYPRFCLQQLGEGGSLKKLLYGEGDVESMEASPVPA